jgi:hypothetical protein
VDGAAPELRVVLELLLEVVEHLLVGGVGVLLGGADAGVVLVYVDLLLLLLS